MSSLSSVFLSSYPPCTLTSIYSRIVTIDFVPVFYHVVIDHSLSQTTPFLCIFPHT